MTTPFEQILAIVRDQCLGDILIHREEFCEFLLPSMHPWGYKLGCAIHVEKKIFIVSLCFDALPLARSEQDQILPLLQQLEDTHKELGKRLGEICSIFCDEKIFVMYKIELSMEGMSRLNNPESAKTFLHIVAQDADRLLPMIAGMRDPRKFALWKQSFYTYVYGDPQGLPRA